MQGTQTLRFAAQTDKGLRQSNADAVFADGKLFIVADGVGTGKNSGLASEMAVNCICEATSAGAKLPDAVQQAHVLLREFNAQHSTEQAIGTTVVAAQLTGTEGGALQGKVIWAGDSRAYVIDVQHNQVTQLTHDHSYVNKLVQRGDITQEQAKSHPQRNVITRCLGLTQKHEIKLDSQEFTLAPHQILLLCSDGLSGPLRQSVLLTFLQQAKDLDTAADALLQKALKEGSRDNISLVLVQREYILPSH